MKNRSILIFLTALLPIFAWGQQTPQDKEKELRDYIDKTVVKYEEMLELEDWQIFYLDSIYTHDYAEMSREMDQLGQKMVSNTSLYVSVQDKWMERIYQAIHKILTPEQWARFNKNGNGRDKKERDKRMKKAQGL
ncbi:MAG: hypothetical protein MJY61_00040 [Bacteroidales bacterium]|nr:hypothetical protein [Bacteroidales bacterium]